MNATEVINLLTNILGKAEAELELQYIMNGPGYDKDLDATMLLIRSVRGWAVDAGLRGQIYTLPELEEISRAYLLTRDDKDVSMWSTTDRGFGHCELARFFTHLSRLEQEAREGIKCAFYTDIDI